MSWFEAIPSLACALALVLLPGVPIAWALGARGISFVAVSVGGSIAAIATAAVAAPLLGLTWQPYAPFVVSVPVTALGFVLRRWWLRWAPEPRSDAEWRRTFLVSSLAVLAGAVLIALPLKAGIGMPDWLAQTPDVSFHFNAVRHMLDTGNASSLAVSLGPHSPASPYPAAWHALVALVTQLSGASIAVAANATTFAIACLIWPVGCVFLARQIFGPAGLPMVLAGVFSAAFGAFPLFIVQYGVLYPYLLGVALMPIALGLFVLAVGRAHGAHMEIPGRWLAFGCVLVGIAMSHPSAALAVLALSIPLVARVVIDRLGDLGKRRQLPVRGTVVVIAFLAGVVAFGAVWLKLGEGPGANLTEPYESSMQALGEALSNGVLERPPALFVSVLAIFGIAIAIRSKKHRWLIASYVICVVLYMVATSWQPGPLRSALVGIWYNNLPRLAALLPLFAVPLATLGAVSGVRWAQNRIAASRRVAALRPLTTRRVMAVLAMFAVVLTVPLIRDSSIALAQTEVEDTYQLSHDSALLTPDELAVFALVSRSTPKDAVIGGNPWNGSALVYAYANREALFPHVRGSWRADQLELAADFASASPSACAAVRKLGVTYVLGFGDRYLSPGNPRTKEYPGFDDLSQSRAVTLVAQRGGAKLYKVTGCGVR